MAQFLRVCKLEIYCVARSYGIRRQYSSQWEYEVRTAGGVWPPPPQKPNEYFGLLVALMCVGLGLLQFIYIYYTKVKKIAALRNTLIENEYKQIRESARNKANEFSINDLNSEEDLKKYLTRRQ
ncbi:hypothetical protein ALC60_02647 [Trachymyrmex zeteki]|uniref:Uncharacterized protein n=1 Tax=Mycetomoellerius zeteki TaxID=64791 RepID=A0A151XCZ2_9HYME|nr:hypothetical protein ALC60_02647 [Trachymyrmex zeteki]